MNQREVIDYLKAKGISISNNFISRQEFSPLKYLAMYNYDIPESIINYSGQKKGYLGVAIKNLVYQAGKYDTFCDIFGGSGAASLAVNKVDGTKYI